jgi:hypothetical protein
VDRGLTYRATLLKEWMGSESYALVQTMLRELCEQRVHYLRTEGKELHDTHAGVWTGLTLALNLAEQTILDESRQRPQEERP